jgi:type II secretory pathway pseudopilin PulG
VIRVRGRGCPGRPRPRCRRFRSRSGVSSAHGWTLVELVLVGTVLMVIVGTSVPVLTAGLDRSRTEAAARYLASRFALARMDAVKRSASVAIRFEDGASAYQFTVYVDGNRNGVRTRDIERQVDRPLGRSERLGDNFPGVTIGVLPDIGISSDPVQIGASSLMTFTPLGTATSGTVYIRGRGPVQYAVRVLGVTGRTRVLRYEAETGVWLDR